jgi:SAM-dependent methyltransferase
MTARSPLILGRTGAHRAPLQDPATVLGRHRQVWQQKPALRRLYQEEFFSPLLRYRRPSGPTVEIGAGPGFLREMAPEIVATDIVFCPWLNAVVDAQCLPFKSGSVANLIGLDALHHMEKPLELLSEALRVLQPGGRCIFVEPWITPFSYLVYRYLHQEDCDLRARPLEGTAVANGADKDPFDGNGAIPYLLFASRHLSATRKALPGFDVTKVELFSLFGYMLTGGFKPFNLLPLSLYPAVMALEHWTLPLWRNIAALRAVIVLEKRS